jgi:hypothetical protein
MENSILEINAVADESLKYKLVYLSGRRVFGRARNKTYPKVTQCLIFENGLLIASSTAVKCDCDEYNLPFALKLVTKKAIPAIWLDFVRVNVWSQLDSFIKDYKQL